MKPISHGTVFSVWGAHLISLMLVCGWLFFAVESAHAAIRHQQWTEILSRYVVDGVVDYQGFKQSEQELDNYLAVLAETYADQLAENDQLAFYINAYNAYTVKLILNHFKNGRPPESIRKIGGLFKSPWDIRFAVLGGETYSLDNIEHDIIRKRFAEPRIHFAVNCASKSCPPLISDAYEGDTIDTQLEDSTRSFLEDSAHNYFQGDTLYVSSIFKWYKEDFADDPAAFFIGHVTGDLKAALDSAADRIVVRYIDYDWSLNGTPSR